MLGSTVSELVRSFSSPSTSLGDFERDVRKATRVLSSSGYYSSTESVDELSTAIAFKLSKRDAGIGNDQAACFSEAVTRLKSDRALKRKAEIVNTLYGVSRLQQSPSTLSAASVRCSKLTFSSSRKRPTAVHYSAASSGSISASSSRPMTRDSATAHRHSHDSTPASTAPAFMQLASQRSNPRMAVQVMDELIARPRHVVDIPADFDWQFEEVRGEAVDESILVRDILYACQGLDSRLIETRSDGTVAAKASVRLLPAQRRVVAKVCQCAVLHRKVSDSVNGFANGRRKEGLIVQALVAAFDEELTGLYQQFGALHEEVQHSVLVGDSFDLAKLALSLAPATERLFVLNKFCEALAISSAIHGGMVISHIYKFTRSGDPLVLSLSASVLDYLCRPLFAMIGKWVTEGELCDPFDEFFIVGRGDVQLREMWTKKYAIRNKQIPVFISREVVDKIYAIGRNLNFLRVCCADADYSPSVEWSATVADLSKNIDELCAVTNGDLMAAMNSKFKLMAHIECLRKYLCLAQGDFVQELLRLVSDELSDHWSTVKTHSLQSKLETAVLNSNAQFDEMKDRLKVAVLSQHSCVDGGAAVIGWDVFSLKYAVQLPVSVVLSRAVMAKYQSMFHFLIRLKRSKELLKGGWIAQMRGRHEVEQFADLSAVRNVGAAIRNGMNHVLQVLESYFMVDVLETAWNKLTATEWRTMDELIAAHQCYVNSVLTGLFLQPCDEQRLKRPLEDILTQIDAFCPKYEKLSNDVTVLRETRQRRIERLVQDYVHSVTGDCDDRSLSASDLLGDSFLDGVRSSQRQRADQKTGDEVEDEFMNEYNDMRQIERELIFLWKNFHSKLKKFLDVTIAAATVSGSVDESIIATSDHSATGGFNPSAATLSGIEQQSNNGVSAEMLERLMIQLDFNDYYVKHAIHVSIRELPVSPTPLSCFVTNEAKKRLGLKKRHSFAPRRSVIGSGSVGRMRHIGSGPHSEDLTSSTRMSRGSAAAKRPSFSSHSSMPYSTRASTTAALSEDLGASGTSVTGKRFRKKKSTTTPLAVSSAMPTTDDNVDKDAVQHLADDTLWKLDNAMSSLKVGVSGFGSSTGFGGGSKSVAAKSIGSGVVIGSSHLKSSELSQAFGIGPASLTALMREAQQMTAKTDRLLRHRPLDGGRVADKRGSGKESSHSSSEAKMDGALMHASIADIPDVFIPTPLIGRRTAAKVPFAAASGSGGRDIFTLGPLDDSIIVQPSGARSHGKLESAKMSLSASDREHMAAMRVPQFDFDKLQRADPKAFQLALDDIVKEISPMTASSRAHSTDSADLTGKRGTKKLTAPRSAFGISAELNIDSEHFDDRFIPTPLLNAQRKTKPRVPK